VQTALFVQQSASVAPVTAYLAVSLNRLVPQDAALNTRHLRALSTQHVLSSVVVQAVFAQRLCLWPALQVRVEQDALVVQQTALVVPVAPYFVGSLNVFSAQLLALKFRHLAVSTTQHLLSSEVTHADFAQYKLS
jgi:hypothetical protein